MTDMDKLIEAVKAGEATEFQFLTWRPGLTGTSKESRMMHRAYHGSLDAAISLYEAILGHDAGWTVSQHIAKVVMGEFGADGVFESVIVRNPARALLLSTLKAYRSQCPTCPEKS